MRSDADLEEWILAALRANKGAASIVDIAKHIWENHETELRQSGDLFYTWQYRMRWAAQRLQHAGKLRKLKEGARARWTLIA